MRHRLLKSLRIAVTAVSLLVCALLIVLWGRSYSHPSGVNGPLFNSVFTGYSFDGIAHIGIRRGTIRMADEWRTETLPDRFVLWLQNDGNWIWEYHKENFKLAWIGRVPYRFMFIVTATLAAIPWIKWRFSLRTLLIVLTLFALFFGVIAISM